MTVNDVLDRLAGKRVSRIVFRDGEPLNCPHPVLVEYADNTEGEHPEMWIGIAEDGLSLHFNAKDQFGEFRGHSEPLSNISHVS